MGLQDSVLSLNTEEAFFKIIVRDDYYTKEICIFRWSSMKTMKKGYSALISGVLGPYLRILITFYQASAKHFKTIAAYGF